MGDQISQFFDTERVWNYWLDRIFSHGTMMNFVVELLLWPVVMFLQAVCGVLGPTKTPQMVMYQKIARLALFASVGVFCMIPLSLLFSTVLGGIQPLLALGVVLLLVFVVFGNLCDDQVRDDDDGESGKRD